MREIILDTETTGLNKKEDRIIEIGCVELINKIPTGRQYHQYINPEGKIISAKAEEIHGINNKQLEDKPFFKDIAADFLSFIGDSILVAHNALFDISFINEELFRMGLSLINLERIVDSLALARQKHPMGPNSLDALCKRYNISNSHRKLHGALLDAQLLAEVYIELTGGKQQFFSFELIDNKENSRVFSLKTASVRPEPLPARLSAYDQEKHREFIRSFPKEALWNKFL